MEEFEETEKDSSENHERLTATGLEAGNNSSDIEILYKDEASEEPYFTRVELIVLIVATVLFSIFIVVLVFRLCQIAIYRIKLAMEASRDGSRPRRVTAQERRVSGLISRPGVRDILASRVREARVMEDREEAKRRARHDQVLPHVASVVRMAPSPTFERHSPRAARGRRGSSSNSTTAVAPTPPPSYSQIEEPDRASVCSEGPPPSYHSKMGD